MAKRICEEQRNDTIRLIYQRLFCFNAIGENVPARQCRYSLLVVSIRNYQLDGLALLFLCNHFCHIEISSTVMLRDSVFLIGRYYKSLSLIDFAILSSKNNARLNALIN